MKQLYLCAFVVAVGVSMECGYAQAPAALAPVKTLATAGLAPQEPPEGQDPVLGQWTVDGRGIITLAPDSTITGGRHGTWHYHGIVEGGRHYELRWLPPKNWSDWVNISEDGNHLEGLSRGKPISYFRKTESVATLASTTPGPAKVEPDSRPSEILAKEAPNAMEWALAPLNETVSGDIRRNLTLLREDLLDEAAKKPVVNRAAYKLGEELCNSLITALDARDESRVRAGYSAAQAKANMGEVTDQRLEARRRFTSWPTYHREKDQREELRKAKENGAALANQRPVLEWAARGAQFRRMIDGLYAQYREASRQPLVAR